MLDLKPITPEFIAECRPYVDADGAPLCDYAPGCLFMWREAYRVRGTITHGMLVCMAEVDDPHVSGVVTVSYSCPLGHGDFDAAIREIVLDAEARGVKLMFSAVAEKDVPRIEAAVGRPIASTDDSLEPDYVYPVGNFLGYPGKALHAHRNHVNRFLRENPDAVYAPLSDENRKAAMAFIREHHSEMEKADPMSEEDLIRAEELIRLFDVLGLTGGVLYAGGRVAGVTVGETVADMLHVSVEKALHTLPGAFQVLAMRYAEQEKAAHPELAFINRQDDAGDPGLRQSKQSYKPCAMLKKINIIFD